MELNKTKKWFYALATLSSLFILSLGAWWLYLVFKLATKLESLHIPDVTGNLMYMVQWEGISFILVMLILTFTMLYLFIQDRKKSQAISSFFASMTHELKTPLASIRLQGQVIAELVEDLSIPNNQLKKYVERLKEDTIRLENEVDRSLQLSRLEQGGNLNLHTINLNDFIKKITKPFDKIEFKITCNHNLEIMADELALEMIFRNLIENTIRHNKSEKKEVYISISSSNQKVKLSYHDNGNKFSGNIKKLGHLFYKYNSPKGSGIGLYLIKKLSTKMGGNFKIIQNEKLYFDLEFLKAL